MNMFRKVNDKTPAIKPLAAISISIPLVFIVTMLAILFNIFAASVSAVACPPPLQFCSGVGIVVNPQGNSGNTTSRCDNSITSCGTYPNCLDLSQLSYCVNGHVTQSYCLGNVPRNKTMTDHCTPTTNFVMRARGHDNSDKQLTVTLFSPGTNSNPVLTSSFTGNSSILSPLPIVDSKIDFDNSHLTIFMKSLNVTKLQSAGTANVTIERVSSSITISGATVGKAYLVELPSSFSFTSLVLNVSYSDVSISNTSNLVLYRCGSYNFATGNCDSGWELKTGVTIDTTNQIISVPLTGFSVYSLAEQGATTTTTTTTSSTSTATQSSSSSNSVQNIYSSSASSSSSSSAGQVCSVNSDCCSGKTSGYYSCTPGGCAVCDPSSAGCFSCATTTSSSSSTTSTTATNTNTAGKKTETGFAIAWPVLSIPMLIPLSPEMFFTFFVGFVSGFAIALFVKSGLNIQSLRPRYSGMSRGRKYYEGRYRNISNAGNAKNARSWDENRKSKKSFGETKLVLQ